jgi:outer membrane protein OmpA-like peptidoglycan-associated protein
MEDNPTLKIEISAHTDSRLEDRYNLWLSQKRADSVLEYLVQKGISKERIVAKGYGETRLINRCANGVICSEEEHLVNRRTEFVILEF